MWDLDKGLPEVLALSLGEHAVVNVLMLSKPRSELLLLVELFGSTDKAVCPDYTDLGLGVQGESRGLRGRV